MRPAELKPTAEQSVAIFHLSVKTLSRSAGRSATAAAAYRSATQITDLRTGEVHDYRRKAGVESALIILPEDAPAWAIDREQLWNAAEHSEKRKNSTVAREFEIALPDELSAEQREKLAHHFAKDLVEQHGCAADVCIHAPSEKGDHRNHHAHILLTTRRLVSEGFADKTREFDEANTGRAWVHKWRERFAVLQNEYLSAAGHDVRVDHRSHAARGLSEEPSRHLGPAATGYERRTSFPSRKRLRFEHEREITERLLSAQYEGELERENLEVDANIISLSSELAAALHERDERRRQESMGKPPELTPWGQARWQAIAKDQHDLQLAGLERDLSWPAWDLRDRLKDAFGETREWTDEKQISLKLQSLEAIMMADAGEQSVPMSQAFAEIMGLSPLRAGPDPKLSDLVFVAKKAAQYNFDQRQLELEQAQSNFNEFQALVRRRALQQKQLTQTVGGWQGDDHWQEWQRRVAKLKHFDPNERNGPVRTARIYVELLHQALQEHSAYELDWQALELEAIWQGLVMNREYEVARDIAEHSPMRITPESRVELSALVAAQERAMNPEPDPRDRGAEDDYGNEPGF